MVGALCTKAEVYEGGTDFGDPTEVALVRFAERVGLSQRQLRRTFQEVGGNPFSSERKRKAVVVRKGSDNLSLVKGAPDAVLPRRTHLLSGTQLLRLTPERRREIMGVLDGMTAEALRVLASAFRPLGPRILPE